MGILFKSLLVKKGKLYFPKTGHLLVFYAYRNWFVNGFLQENMVFH